LNLNHPSADPEGQAEANAEHDPDADGGMPDDTASMSSSNAAVDPEAAARAREEKPPLGFYEGGTVEGRAFARK
jgi:hypothetical protein